MKTGFYQTGAVALALLALAGCGKANFKPETATAVRVASDIPAPSVQDQLAAQRPVAVGPGDTLVVQVLGVTDLTRTLKVDDAGVITFPLAGSINILGLGAHEVEQAIATRLAGRYVRNPQVTVTVTEAVSQRLVVGGAVRSPGLVPVVGRATLSQAIAQAGGVSDLARFDEVVLMRNVSGQRYAARFSLDDIYGGRANDPEVFANDRIVVGTDKGRGLLRDIAPLTPILGIFYQIL